MDKKSGIVVAPVVEKRIKRVDVNNTSNRQMLNALCADGIDVGDSARQVVLQAPSVIVVESFDFVMCEIGDLGFKNPVPKHELWDCIRNIGRLCSVPPVLHLRRQFKDQPLGDHVYIAMEGLHILYLSCSGTERRKKLYLGNISMGDKAPIGPKLKIAYGLIQK
ncbi:MAG: hypothetical protein WC798_02125 [Candidatus Paceibacterota bacterium]